MDGDAKPLAFVQGAEEIMGVFFSGVNIFLWQWKWFLERRPWKATQQFWTGLLLHIIEKWNEEKLELTNIFGLSRNWSYFSALRLWVASVWLGPPALCLQWCSCSTHNCSNPRKTKSKVALLRVRHNTCAGYITVVWLWAFLFCLFGVLFFRKHFLVKVKPS